MKAKLKQKRARKPLGVSPRSTAVFTVEKPRSAAQDRLRRRYRPATVKILFVGESAPASGRFFYQADSGLYRAMREAFVAVFPGLQAANFLDAFRGLGCYLVDLCGAPVDRLGPKQRRQACQDGEERLSRVISKLQPGMIITVVRSIGPNVARAQRRANWTGTHMQVSYPGRWHLHRVAFVEALSPALQNLRTS
jgi:hypothetical protein